ncbi:BarA sensory histidine kinase (= VarS = GacS) [hydrothermal vent metagenome]|uniref:histidine kinase n=1 Tax=hydrothermal vent metagenome TaxID=652676 RepID=A0A3B0WJV4_9ZZZZ
MIKLHKRAQVYWAVAIVLLLGSFSLSDSNWIGTVELHTLMEAVATIFALFIGSLALLKYYSRGGTDFLVLGAGFIGISLLDGYHAIVSSIWFKAYLPSDLSSLIPWSWLASRFMLSLMFLVLYIVLKWEYRNKLFREITPKRVFSLVAVITLSSFAFFAFVPLPNGYFEANLIHRPEEYVPAALLTLALIGHLQLDYWRNNSFYHWFILSIIINLAAQITIMPYSNELFDLPFDIAHILKKISYLCILTGLGINVFNAFRDIDEQNEYRRKAHLTLEASEIRNKTMMNTLVDSLILINNIGIIENINASACKLFGYAKLEVLGKNIKILMPNPHHDKHDSYLKNHILTGKNNIINIGGRKLLGLKKDKSTFPIDLTVSEMFINGKTKFTGIIRDDTERLKNETELINAKNDAQQGAETKSNFLASMSHEIRTPMNGVLGMVELLQDTPLNEVQKDIIDTISDSGKALLEIINDILEYSKVEAGKIELEYISFNLERTIYDITRLLISKAEEKNIELIFYYHTHCPTYVIGDAGRIRQILLNLVGNAIKFTDNGKIIIEVKYLESNDKKYNLHIEVNDSGIGIDNKAKEKLFESFSQADNSTSRKYGGSGLGLTISKRLIKLMQGNIDVESELGKGSTFWIELNLEIAKSPKIIEQVNLDNINILIIDDNKLSIKILKSQLEKLNMKVSVESNPQLFIHTIETAQQHNKEFKLIIINNIIQNISGKNIGIEIKKHNHLKNIPLIYLTSAAKLGDANKYKNIGFSSYLTKPILSDLLYKTLSRVLGLTKNNDEDLFLTRHSVLEDEIEINNQEIKFKGKILLVEDVIVNQKVALGLMAKLGLDIDVANNGEEAVDQNNLNSYDLILMDCQMPVLDGYQATQKIRETNKTIPIVALTANALASDRLKCTESGMTDYLTKPFNRQQIIQILSRWLSISDVSHDITTSAAENSREIPTSKSTISQGKYNENNTINTTILSDMKNILGEIFDDLIPAYITQSDDIINDMKNAYINNDLITLERYAHSIKSSSYNVGAEWLSNEASLLEQMCQMDNQDNKIKSKIDSIISDYKCIKIKLQNYQK